MKIIGLTGTIASGKTTITQYLSSKQIPIVDSDKIAREVASSKGCAFQEIISAFGEGILKKGEIDRQKLAGIVFSNSEKRALLESIIHPHIIENMRAQAQFYRDRGEKLIIFDLPLLVEANLGHLCDEIWVVYAGIDTQIERLKHRNGHSEEFSRKVIASQIPTEEKLKYADIAIENNGSLEELHQKIEEALKHLT